MASTRPVFPLALAVACLASAARPGAAQPAWAEAKPGVVFVVGGVGGIDFIGLAARVVLPSAGVRHEIRDFVWTHGTGRLLRDLQDTRHLLVKADELAAEVRQVKEADPGRPVYLVGHSGGAGLVLAAAEQLPPATVERLVLLSAAVAPDYDLRPALRATRREVVSYHSEIDCFWLGWGTSQFGTVDRYYGSAAGRTGFLVPARLDRDGRELYARLVQVGWHPEMVLRGHGGLHHSTSMPGFLTKQVAPWLRP